MNHKAWLVAIGTSESYRTQIDVKARQDDLFPN